jgi:Tfp pilus assembly protein PilN
MQSVNLLPPGYAQKQRAKRRFVIGVGVMIAALLVTFGLSRLMDQMVRKKEEAVQLLADEASDLKATRAELDRCNRRLTRLSGRLAVVYTLDRNRRWASALSKVAAAAQDTIFLTRLHIEPAKADAGDAGDAAPPPAPAAAAPEDQAADASAKPEQLVMLIQGYAISNTDVTRFISALNETGLFEKVSFRGSEMALVKTRHLSRFELACPVRFVPKVRSEASDEPGSAVAAEPAIPVPQISRAAAAPDEEVAE